jgi:oligosaccharide repeat unit polymerase
MLRVMLVGSLTIAVAAAARFTERSWLSPAAVFALLWGGYVVAAAGFFTDPEVVLGGMLWVLLAAAAVYAGSLFARLTVASRGPAEIPAGSEPMPVPLYPHLRAFGLITALIGFSEIYYLFARQGHSFRGLVSFAVIAQLTADNRAAYGYGDLQQGVLERVVFAILYTAPLFGGVLFRTARSAVDRGLAILQLLLPVIVLALYGSRMGALFGGSFWVASYLAAIVAETHAGERASARTLVRILAVAAAVLLGFSAAAQGLRYTATVQHLDWLAILADPFGFLAAFGIWFDQEGGRWLNFFVGARTFRRVVEVFGISQPFAPEIYVGFTRSNIYTVLRDLIEDFGSVGALVFLFAYGTVGTVAFERLARGNLRYFPLLTLVFAFALTSFANSIFLYTVTAMAVVAFFAYFTFARVRWHRLPRAANAPG